MIFTARQLQEKCQEQNVDLYMTFVDLTKAFNIVEALSGVWGFREKGYLFSGIWGEGPFIFRDLGSFLEFYGAGSRGLRKTF